MEPTVSDLPRTTPGMQRTDRKTRQTEAVWDLHQTWPLPCRTKQVKQKLYHTMSD